jgi:hypothetical protein
MVIPILLWRNAVRPPEDARALIMTRADVTVRKRAVLAPPRSFAICLFALASAIAGLAPPYNVTLLVTVGITALAAMGLTLLLIPARCRWGRRRSWPSAHTCRRSSPAITASRHALGHRGRSIRGRGIVVGSDHAEAQGPLPAARDARDRHRHQRR